MASRARSSVSLLGLAVVLMCLASVPAVAFDADAPENRPVESDGENVVKVILQKVDGSLQATLGGASGGGGGGEPSCELRVEVLPELGGVDIIDTWVPDSIPVRIVCGLAVINELWVPMGEIIDIDAMVAAEAERYVRTVLGPGLSLGTSPPSNVLVGLATWFWIDGWDGSPINTSVVAPWGESILIELSLDHVQWDFGDGSAPVNGDLGQPFPEESSVQHVYTHRSTSVSSPDGAYTLTASIQINVRYWYDGQGPFSVAPLVQEHTDEVVVRQAQAVLG